MNQRILRTFLSIAMGAAISLLSGLFKPPFTRILIDVVEWGAPLSWLMRVIPIRMYSINLPNQVIDLAFWSVIVYFVVAVAVYFRHRKAPKIQ